MNARIRVPIVEIPRTNFEKALSSEFSIPYFAVVGNGTRDTCVPRRETETPRRGVSTDQRAFSLPANNRIDAAKGPERTCTFG